MNQTPSWVQLVFITNPENSEVLSDALEAAGSVAVTLLDAADQALFDIGQEEIELWDQVRLIALFDTELLKSETELDQIIQLLKTQTKNIPPYELVPLENEDWERTWMTRFKPMQFGKNVWICPTWETPPDPDAINLILDPGMAFGTGTHETTSLCLTWLANNQASIKNKKVIDYGCGSGILAIAAGRLGAKSVWAVDIEQQALDSTKENARSNNVLEIMTISGPNLDLKTEGVVDGQNEIKTELLIANILANPLIKLAPLFADYSLPGGKIILSGILEQQVPKILAAYRLFYTFKEPLYENEWALLEGTRRTQ
ncbi:MAG: 50S ribosomal protein L11 methyltransferase [Gammaproteobacteria bacterium]